MTISLIKVVETRPNCTLQSVNASSFIQIIDQVKVKHFLSRASGQKSKNILLLIVTGS